MHLLGTRAAQEPLDAQQSCIPEESRKPGVLRITFSGASMPLLSLLRGVRETHYISISVSSRLLFS